jgi:hypothetical protein
MDCVFTKKQAIIHELKKIRKRFIGNEIEEEKCDVEIY